MLLAVLAGAPAARADAPTVRPLEETPDAPAPADAEPARRLPSTVAVCRDAPGQCRTAARSEDCGGLDRVFRVVPDGPAVAAALAECRAAPETAN